MELSLIILVKINVLDFGIYFLFEIEVMYFTFMWL